MSDEQLPPTHQPWGARPDPEPSSQPPPPAPPSPSPSPSPSGAPYQPPPNPYPQPGSFDQYAAPNPYAPQDYGQPYGAYPGGYGAMLPDHPSATTALVLGIVSLVGALVCLGLPLVLAPFAWVIGGRAVREIDASPGRYGGRSNANAGRIMGIIGTVVLVLGAVALFALIAVGLSVGASDGGGGTPSPVISHHQAENS